MMDTQKEISEITRSLTARGAYFQVFRHSLS